MSVPLVALLLLADVMLVMTSPLMTNGLTGEDQSVRPSLGGYPSLGGHLEKRGWGKHCKLNLCFDTVLYYMFDKKKYGMCQEYLDCCDVATDCYKHCHAFLQLMIERYLRIL